MDYLCTANTLSFVESTAENPNTRFSRLAQKLALSLPNIINKSVQSCTSTGPTPDSSSNSFGDKTINSLSTILRLRV